MQYIKCDKVDTFYGDEGDRETFAAEKALFSELLTLHGVTKQLELNIQYSYSDAFFFLCDEQTVRRAYQIGEYQVPHVLELRRKTISTLCIGLEMVVSSRPHEEPLITALSEVKMAAMTNLQQYAHIPSLSAKTQLNQQEFEIWLQEMTSQAAQIENMLVYDTFRGRKMLLYYRYPPFRVGNALTSRRQRYFGGKVWVFDPETERKLLESFITHDMLLHAEWHKAG